MLFYQDQREEENRDRDTKQIDHKMSLQPEWTTTDSLAVHQGINEVDETTNRKQDGPHQKLTLENKKNSFL
jgi:hypothetical protein